MTIPHEQAKALHLEGGNYFDDIRIDISESHQRLANLTTTPKSIKQPKYRNIMRVECLNTILEKTQLIYGKIEDINKSIGFCISRKKAASSYQ